jgi:hypothetical protein
MSYVSAGQRSQDTSVKLPADLLSQIEFKCACREDPSQILTPFYYTYLLVLPLYTGLLNCTLLCVGGLLIARIWGENATTLGGNSTGDMPVVVKPTPPPPAHVLHSRSTASHFRRAS